jgi:hypothetical protein
MSFFFDTETTPETTPETEKEKYDRLLKTEREEYDRLLKEDINRKKWYKKYQQEQKEAIKQARDKEARKKYLEQKFNPTKTPPTFNDREDIWDETEEDRRERKERIAVIRENKILNIIKLKQQYPAISLERAILKKSEETQFYYKDKRLIKLFNLEEAELSSNSKSPPKQKEPSPKKQPSPPKEPSPKKQTPPPIPPPIQSYVPPNIPITKNTKPKFLDGNRSSQKQLLDNLMEAKNKLRKPKPKSPPKPPPFPKRSTIQAPLPSKRITDYSLKVSKNKLKPKYKSPKALEPTDPNYNIEMMFRDMNKKS